MINVSGFTFIKNGLTLEYPILESIQSIDPLCDEVVINVGFDVEDCSKDDGTYEHLRDNLRGDRYRFIKSYWDPNMTKGGLILSQQTNIALEQCRGKFGQYIQGDEAIHEIDHDHIRAGIQSMEEDPELEALVFNYLHFFGNVNLIKVAPSVYRRECRTIRLGNGLKSFQDAQGFRYTDGKKPKAKLIPARIFHYGWARTESVMSQKINSFAKLYHGSDHEPDEFKYHRVWGIRRFEESHPSVMKDWIEKNKNDVSYDDVRDKCELLTPRYWIRSKIENLTGWRMGEFKNYSLK